jgi:3'-phosphoadenosine 5'-phosphosulfate sulfotransferase (PAPS reductase)/FAD synthetase
MKVIVSFGGGVNSSAMLVGMKEKQVYPDAILFADTGGEKPETYSHIERMGKWLKDNDMPEVVIVSEKKTLEDDCAERETLPGKAFGFGSCSEHFKVRPQRRWLKAQGIKEVMWCVGIHAGEERRAWRVLNQRADVQFPLLNWGWDQDDCLAALDRADIPHPVKSACFY